MHQEWRTRVEKCTQNGALQRAIIANESPARLGLNECTNAASECSTTITCPPHRGTPPSRPMRYARSRGQQPAHRARDAELHGARAGALARATREPGGGSEVRHHRARALQTCGSPPPSCRRMIGSQIGTLLTRRRLESRGIGWRRAGPETRNTQRIGSKLRTGFCFDSRRLHQIPRSKPCKHYPIGS